MERVPALPGIEIRVRRAGSSTPIVFVHGAMDRSSAFLRSARILEDHPVIVYDRRGYGRSVLGATDPVPEITAHVADLQAILRFCADEMGRTPILVGHSLGGTIALLAAAHRSQSLAGLVVFESPLLWEPWWPRRSHLRPSTDGAPIDDPAEGARMAESFLRRAIGDEQWESLPDRTRVRRLEEGRVLRAELLSCRAIAPPEFAALTAPVILAVGSKADEVRHRAVSTLVAAIPSARAVVVEGAPHNLHTSDPRRFSALITDLDPGGGIGSSPTA